MVIHMACKLGTLESLMLHPDAPARRVEYSATTTHGWYGVSLSSVNIAEAKTLLPMIRSLLAGYPLKRMVLEADRGRLSVNNLASWPSCRPRWLPAGTP